MVKARSLRIATCAASYSFRASTMLTDRLSSGPARSSLNRLTDEFSVQTLVIGPSAGGFAAFSAAAGTLPAMDVVTAQAVTRLNADTRTRLDRNMGHHPSAVAEAFPL